MRLSVPINRAKGIKKKKSRHEGLKLKKSLRQDKPQHNQSADLVVVTDDENCEADTFFTLVSPPLIESSLIDSSEYNGFEISCNSLSDGSLNASIIGGYGDYNYLWSTIDGDLSNTAIDRDSIWNLPAGTYTLTVTDAINCPNSFDYVLNEADSLTIDPILSNYSNFNISCFNVIVRIGCFIYRLMNIAHVKFANSCI